MTWAVLRSRIPPSPTPASRPSAARRRRGGALRGHRPPRGFWRRDPGWRDRAQRVDDDRPDSRQPADRVQRHSGSHRHHRPVGPTVQSQIAQATCTLDLRVGFLPRRPGASPRRVGSGGRHRRSSRSRRTSVVRQISISGKRQHRRREDPGTSSPLTHRLGSGLPAACSRTGARIQALYKAEGYYLAEVGHEIETLSTAAGGNPLHRFRGREAQAPQHRVHRQRGLLGSRVARGLQDQEVALLVLRNFVVRQVRGPTPSRCFSRT